MPILTSRRQHPRFRAAGPAGPWFEGIAKSLAKRTVAMALDGVVQDLDDTIVGMPRSSSFPATIPAHSN